MIGILLDRIALAFASAGLAIATALTFAHTSNTLLPCGGSNGCEKVSLDPSSYFLGIPISAFGIFAYLFLVILSILRIWGFGTGEKRQFPNLRQSQLAGAVISTAGTLTSIGLTYYSVTHIHATCAWCIGSGTMMLGSTITYLALLRSKSVVLEESRPASALLWFVIPAIGVASIAVLGSRDKKSTPELDTVNLSVVSFKETIRSDHVLGLTSAPIMIAEFGDLMCPACRDMHGRVLTFHLKFPNKVSIVFNHFPLVQEEGHELSEPAALLSEQLSASDFWTFVNSVYGAETKPTSQNLNSLYAKSPSKGFRSQQKAYAELDRQIALGKKYGIQQTPTYVLFIDQKPIAVATSTDLAKTLSRPEFARIIEGK